MVNMLHEAKVYSWVSKKTILAVVNMLHEARRVLLGIQKGAGGGGRHMPFQSHNQAIQHW